VFLSEPKTAQQYSQVFVDRAVAGKKRYNRGLSGSERIEQLHKFLVSSLRHSLTEELDGLVLIASKNMYLPKIEIMVGISRLSVERLTAKLEPQGEVPALLGYAKPEVGIPSAVVSELERFLQACKGSQDIPLTKITQSLCELFFRITVQLWIHAHLPTKMRLHVTSCRSYFH
jgi:hypothetical protein